MAVNLKHEDGSKTVIFPSHDPDKQDEGLALELAVDRTREGVIDAARQICGNVDAVSGEEYIQAVEDALAAFDAAVAENRAHDDTVQPEPAPSTWNERRSVLLSEVNRTHFYFAREQGSLKDFVRMGVDRVIVEDQRAEVERRRAAWQAAVQRYKDERLADAEPQP